MYMCLQATKKDRFVSNPSNGSLATINATLGLFKAAYSNTEDKSKKFDTKMSQKRTASLLLEEWKISSELEQFIKDSWNI